MFFGLFGFFGLGLLGGFPLGIVGIDRGDFGIAEGEQAVASAIEHAAIVSDENDRSREFQEALFEGL